MDIKTYPEMNEKIPALLRMDTDDSGNPDKLSHYAAQLIEEQAAQLKAAEARVKELEQGFREVLVCARNISEGYYEDAALLGRIARSFVGAHKTCTQHKHGR